MKMILFSVPPNQMEAQEISNSPKVLAQGTSSEQLTWKWPLVMAFIRFPLILMGQLLTWGYFAAVGCSNAWMKAVGMTNFYVPLTVDLVCLLLLSWLLWREGLTPGDLMRNHGQQFFHDMLLGLGLFVVAMILFQLTSLISAIIVYGPGIFTATSMSTLQSNIPLPPLLVFWWSLLVLPVTTGIVEELRYRGYVLPRLVALIKRPWLAMLVMASGFGLQHIALPLIDWQTSLSRFIGTFLMGLFFGAVYLKQRHLLPLMIAHWGLNFVGLGLLQLLWVLSQ